MKKIKYLLPIIGIILAFQSCEDEDKIRFPEFQEAANVRIQVSEDYSFLDASDIPNAKFVYSIFSENTNIETVIISGEYYNLENDTTYERREIIRYTQADFDANNGSIYDEEFTTQFLAEKFGLPNGVSDLSGGDLFNFDNITTLTNGMQFPDTILSETPYETVNVTPNILQSAATTSFTATFFTFVGCSSNLEGTYTTITNAQSTDGCCLDPVVVESVVTFTRTGPVNYQVTNFAAGTYAYWYCDPYGLCSDIFDGLPADLLDICDNVQLTAGYWGSSGTGTIDPVTGVITIAWGNVFGDAGVTVYTPQ